MVKVNPTLISAWLSFKKSDMHNRGHVYITLTLKGKGSREDLANEPTLDACGVIRLRACVQISRKKYFIFYYENYRSIQREFVFLVNN